MDGWLGFNGILSTQIAAISCLRKFISKANDVYKRDYDMHSVNLLLGNRLQYLMCEQH